MVSKWLSILGGLGALALVMQNPNGFFKIAKGGQALTAGSVSQIVNAGNPGK